MIHRSPTPAAPHHDALARAFTDGAWASLPTQAMVGPFGLLSGALSAENGLSLLQTVALSVIVFAGAAQIAIVELLASGAPWFVLAATGLVVNLRFLMYGATLAPHLRGAPWALLIPVGYLNIDNSFGLAQLRFAARPEESASARAVFYLGSGVLTWCVWSAATLVGFAFGAAAPAAIGLELAAPISLLALTAPLLRDAPSWAAAATAVTTAILFRDLPLQLGVVAAALAATAAALIVDASTAGPEASR